MYIPEFDDQPCKHINLARINHLKLLNLNLKNKKILETGCGPVGDITEYLETQSSDVIAVDARQDLVEEHIIRFPHRKDRVRVCNLNVDGCFNERFDVVFCYGTLYHLSDPQTFLKYLSSICDDFMIISTAVLNNDNGEINFIQENSNSLNASYDGQACRPSRDWLFSELKKYFSYVYYVVPQPHHSDYPLQWPSSASTCRAIFVGSRNPIDNPYLSTTLLNEQEKFDQIN